MELKIPQIILYYIIFYFCQLKLLWVMYIKYKKIEANLLSRNTLDSETIIITTTFKQNVTKTKTTNRAKPTNKINLDKKIDGLPNGD